jgi:1-acyl-sn-glycerol-3-phosphate acyltransferase
VAAVGGGGFGARSSRHRVSVGAIRSPSPQVLETRWRQHQRRRDTVVRSDVVAGGAAAAAGDSTQPLSGTVYQLTGYT